MPLTHSISRIALVAALILPGMAIAEEVSAWRAFVADQAEGVVSAIDLETSDVIQRFDLNGPASLYATSSGESVFAVQGSANVVQAIASGIAIDDHGDHGDITVTEPSLRDGAIEGDRPVHFVEHRGQIALFFDGEGVAKIIREARFGEAAPRSVATDAPHHGVAAAFGEHILLSEPHPEDPSNLPVGVYVVDGEDNRVGDVHACPELHGEASSGNLMAIACADGLLIVSETASGPQISHIAYGDTLPDGKATTLLGGVGLQYFLGNYGPDRVVLIDPVDEEFRLVDLPTRRVHFAVDPIRPKFAYIFTEDGQLHRLDVVSGALDLSLALTEPYSMDGHWSDPRPRIAVAGDVILVTDPNQGLLHRIDAASFEATDTIAIEGLPMGIVAVGGSGHLH